MAKKTTAAAVRKTTKSRAVEPDAASAAKPVKETKTRASAVPPTKAKAGKSTGTASVTTDMIAEKAYHLWLAGHPGGEHDHWIAAERELRGTK